MQLSLNVGHIVIDRFGEAFKLQDGVLAGSHLQNSGNFAGFGHGEGGFAEVFVGTGVLADGGDDAAKCTAVGFQRIVAGETFEVVRGLPGFLPDFRCPTNVVQHDHAGLHSNAVVVFVSQPDHVFGDFHIASGELSEGQHGPDDVATVLLGGQIAFGFQHLVPLVECQSEFLGDFKDFLVDFGFRNRDAAATALLLDDGSIDDIFQNFLPVAFDAFAGQSFPGDGFAVDSRPCHVGGFAAGGNSGSGCLFLGCLAAAGTPYLHSDATSDQDQQGTAEEQSGAADAAGGDGRIECGHGVIHDWAPKFIAELQKKSVSLRVIGIF